MAGHKITPYELTAVRMYARKDKDVRLLLSSLGKNTAVDLLDAIEDNVELSAASASSDGTRNVSCVRAKRREDTIEMVFACDVSGEREVVHDGDDPEMPVVFTKGEHHRARFYSCCLLWRPPSGDEGLLLVHSPWGRGGSKAQILSVLQRALNMSGDAERYTGSAEIPDGSRLNAFLHMTINALVAYEYGVEEAKGFGDRHEIYNEGVRVDGNMRANRAMDIANNYYGLKLAAPLLDLPSAEFRTQFARQAADFVDRAQACWREVSSDGGAFDGAFFRRSRCGG